jgi:hypothetical protein
MGKTMTRIFILPLLLMVGLWSGCVSDHTGEILPPVGPVTTQAGSLLVFTAHDVNPNFNNVEEYEPHYTDYKIMTGPGRFLQVVHNDAGTIHRHPFRVKLPAGHYDVVAWANGRGLVTVPVIIVAQQLTVVHLDKDVKTDVLGACGL